MTRVDSPQSPTILNYFGFGFEESGADYVSGALASYIAELCVGVGERVIQVSDYTGKQFRGSMAERFPQGWGIAEFESTGWVWGADSSECDLSATFPVLTGCAFWMRSGMAQD